MPHPDIAGIATSGVFLGDIVDAQFRPESLDFGRAGPSRPVFDQDQFEVVARLFGEAFQQFPSFIRAVVYRNNDRKKHVFRSSVI